MWRSAGLFGEGIGIKVFSIDHEAGKREGMMSCYDIYTLILMDLYIKIYFYIWIKNLNRIKKCFYISFFTLLLLKESE